MVKEGGIVRIGEVKKRVNYLLVLREAQRAYIEYKRIPPNPRLEGYDYTTLNTPPQMQRECNVVAFEEWY